MIDRCERLGSNAAIAGYPRDRTQQHDRSPDADNRSDRPRAWSTAALTGRGQAPGHVQLVSGGSTSQLPPRHVPRLDFGVKPARPLAEVGLLGRALRLWPPVAGDSQAAISTHCACGLGRVAEAA